MKVRTFLVEDNPIIRDNLISMLEELTPVQTVGTCETEAEGSGWLTRNSNRWNLAIVDLFLKNGSGLRVLEACRQRSKRQKMVLFSNYAIPEMRSRCAQLGVDAVFDKSTEIDDLLAYCVAQAELLNSAPLAKKMSLPDPAQLQAVYQNTFSVARLRLSASVVKVQAPL